MTDPEQRLEPTDSSWTAVKGTVLDGVNQIRERTEQRHLPRARPPATLSWSCARPPLLPAPLCLHSGEYPRSAVGNPSVELPGLEPSNAQLG